MAIKWKQQYGIEWINNKSFSPCPKCNHNPSKVLNVQSDINRYIKMRRYQCEKCGENWATIECDAERYVDLLDTENTVAGAMNMETTLNKIIDTISASGMIEIKRRKK